MANSHRNTTTWEHRARRAGRARRAATLVRIIEREAVTA